MQEQRKVSRSERQNIRDASIKMKMAKLDDAAVKPFNSTFKRMRHIKAKIDSLETDISNDSSKACDIFAGTFNPRFDVSSWVMKKTLEQYKDVEIESLGRVSLKVMELNSKGKDIIKYLEISPVMFFRRMRSGILRNHNKQCIRNSYLPQTSMLKLFMANQRIQVSEEKEEKMNGTNSNNKNPKKRKRADGSKNKGNNDKELLDLISVMEGELLSEIRETKIRLFRAKALCLELGLDITG